MTYPVTRQVLSRLALTIGLAVTLMTVPAGRGDAAGPATPDALIGEFHATLLHAMRNARALGFAGRRSAIAPRLTATFHLPTMARIVVGAHWRKLTAAQRTALVESFSRMTIATYANRFDGWSGESFEMRGVDDVRPKTVLVKTAILRPNKPAVEINYLVRRFSSGWRVIDVFLKRSYSELATKRSEYTSLLARKGFPALLREIDAKTTQYSSNAG